VKKKKVKDNGKQEQEYESVVNLFQLEAGKGE
jgi:hypothetical protein